MCERFWTLPKSHHSNDERYLSRVGPNGPTLIHNTFDRIRKAADITPMGAGVIRLSVPVFAAFNYSEPTPSIPPASTFRVINADRLDIQASVDLDGLEKLRTMLEKYRAYWK